MPKVFSITDIGRKRKMNQDCVYTSEYPLGSLPNLFIVADGMGGHNAGDFASRATVETIVRKIREASQENPVRALENAIEEANRMIRKKACERPELEGMGTTVVAAFCADGRLEAANVGDSRLYIVNEDIRQVTRDHSLVEEMVRMGGIPREQARNHPDKNIITRAVGAADAVVPDFFSEELKKGDLVLLCSDGLTNMLEDEEIRQIINERQDIAEMAKELVKEANARGGRDNISVILVAP